MNKQFIKALSEVIRNQLSQNKEVRLRKVGIFKKEHQKQFQQQHKDGRVVMVPPKDVIAFISEKENVYG